MVTLGLAPARLAAGRRVYAIGDVHGCADRLAALHAAVGADLDARPCPAPLLVHLGDYIDRGPASAGVIEALLAPPPGLPTVNLVGNHEAMLLAALASGDRSDAAIWLGNGGAETLASWGIGHRTRPRDWALAIPPRHHGFLRGLSLLHRERATGGGYVFVHAGLRPGVALERQVRDDLLWMREPFLSSDADFGAVVVHGHTPEEAPVVRANRIGIDTGAVLGGALTCAVLEADRLGFLTA